MGGNALSQPGVRLETDDYAVVCRDVVAALQKSYPGHRIEVIPSYRTKASFGDLDVLIESSPDYDPKRLAAALYATEVVRNGDVTSVGYGTRRGVFQVDLIKAQPESFDFNLNYFSWNDLGNLIGRVAKACGFKFGHNGLHYVLRDPEHPDQNVGQCLVTRDWHESLDLIGYNPWKYEYEAQEGFQTLDSLFNFAASSRYFDPNVYALENLSHHARVRDRKRANYRGFIEWIETNREVLDELPYDRETLRAERLAEALERFPTFRVEREMRLTQMAQGKQVKALWNGDLVKAWTGLEGRALGALMQRLKNGFADQQAFEDWVLNSTEAERRSYVNNGIQGPDSLGDSPLNAF